MTLASTRNLTTADQIPSAKGEKEPVHDHECSSSDSTGTSRIRSLKKKIRVEGAGLTEISIPLDLIREAIRMANLVANRWIKQSDTSR